MADITDIFAQTGFWWVALFGVVIILSSNIVGGINWILLHRQHRTSQTINRENMKQMLEINQSLINRVADLVTTHPKFDADMMGKILLRFGTEIEKIKEKKGPLKIKIEHEKQSEL